MLMPPVGNIEGVGWFLRLYLPITHIPRRSNKLSCPLPALELHTLRHARPHLRLTLPSCENKTAPPHPSLPMLHYNNNLLQPPACYNPHSFIIDWRPRRSRDDGRTEQEASVVGFKEDAKIAKGRGRGGGNIVSKAIQLHKEG